MVKVKLRPFDPSTFKPNRAILIVGKKGSGKSVLMNMIAWLLSGHVDLAMAITPSTDSKDMFKRFMPACFILHEYPSDKITRLIEHQRACRENGERMNRIVLFLDDVTYDKTIFRRTEIRDILMNQRHLNITLVFAMQYCMDVGPDIRSQIDYVFAFKEAIAANRKRLHTNFFGMFPKLDGFEKAFATCTENFECMVMDSTQATNKLEDQVFYFKATMEAGLPKFRLGRSVFWKMYKACGKRAGTDVPSRLEDLAGDGNQAITSVTKVPKKSRHSKTSKSSKSSSKASRPRVDPIYLDGAA